MWLSFVPPYIFRVTPPSTVPVSLHLPTQHPSLTTIQYWLLNYCFVYHYFCFFVNWHVLDLYFPRWSLNNKDFIVTYNFHINIVRNFIICVSHILGSLFLCIYTNVSLGSFDLGYIFRHFHARWREWGSRRGNGLGNRGSHSFLPSIDCPPLLQMDLTGCEYLNSRLRLVTVAANGEVYSNVDTRRIAALVLIEMGLGHIEEKATVNVENFIKVPTNHLRYVSKWHINLLCSSNHYTCKITLKK